MSPYAPPWQFGVSWYLLGYNEHGERFMTAEGFALMLHTLHTVGAMRWAP